MGVGASRSAPLYRLRPLQLLRLPAGRVGGVVEELLEEGGDGGRVELHLLLPGEVLVEEEGGLGGAEAESGAGAGEPGEGGGRERREEEEEREL